MGPTCRSSHIALYIVAIVILSHLQQISVNFDKLYSVNVRFYFQGPAHDVGVHVYF